MSLTRRRMLFKIIRVVTSKLITGNYSFPAVSEISAEELSQRMNSGDPPLVIDTRSAEEFSSGFGHIPGSRLIPLMEIVVTFPSLDAFKKRVSEIEAQFDEVDAFREKEVVTICPGGGFSLVAAEIMAEAGFTDVKSLSGGIDGWYKQGYPTSSE